MDEKEMKVTTEMPYISDLCKKVMQLFREIDERGFKKDDILLPGNIINIDINRCREVVEKCTKCKEYLDELLSQKENLRYIQESIVCIPYIRAIISSNLVIANAALYAGESFLNNITDAITDHPSDSSNLNNHDVLPYKEEPLAEYGDILNISYKYKDPSGILEDIIKYKNRLGITAGSNKYIDFLRFFTFESAEDGDLSVFIDDKNQDALLFAVLFVDYFSHRLFESMDLKCLPYKWIELVENNKTEFITVDIIGGILVQYWRLCSRIVMFSILYLFYKIILYKDTYPINDIYESIRRRYNIKTSTDNLVLYSNFINELKEISRDMYDITKEGIELTKERKELSFEHDCMVDINILMTTTPFDFNLDKLKRMSTLKRIIERCFDKKDNIKLDRYVNNILSNDVPGIEINDKIQYTRDPGHILEVVGYKFSNDFLFLESKNEDSKPMRKNSKKKNTKFDKNEFNTDF